jgi:hypothetical protein
LIITGKEVISGHFGIRSYKLAALLLCTGLMSPASCGAAGPSLEEVLQRTGKFVELYWQQISLFTCNEAVTQEKLAKKGKIEFRQDSRFDYLALARQHEEDLTIEEVRLPKKLPPGRPNTPSLLKTNGFPSLLLVFHPLYQPNYRYVSAPCGSDKTRSIHFEHIPGTRSSSALMLQNRIYSLDLQGTALVDIESGAILKLNAALAAPIKEINVEAFSIEVNYKPQGLSSETGESWLPSSAVIEIETALQRWRNVHLFSDYKRFTVKSEEISFK